MQSVMVVGINKQQSYMYSVNSRVDKVYDDDKDYFLGNSISQLLVMSNMIDGEQETSDLNLQELHKAKQLASFLRLSW